MEVSIVAPIALLEECCITRTQYCMPRLVDQSEVYRNFYLRRKDEGDRIILDTCKPGWKREPEDLGLVIHIIENLDPDIIILPSYTYNIKKTVEAANAFKRELMGSTLIPCLEGTNKEEVLHCMSCLKNSKYALPSYLSGIVNSKKVGLFLDNKVSFDELDGRDGILITSLPVRLGLSGRLLSDCKPFPPSLTFNETENKYPELLRKNIEETIKFYKE